MGSALPSEPLHVPASSAPTSPELGALLPRRALLALLQTRERPGQVSAGSLDPALPHPLLWGQHWAVSVGPTVSQLLRSGQMNRSQEHRAPSAHGDTGWLCAPQQGQILLLHGLGLSPAEMGPPRCAGRHPTGTGHPHPSCPRAASCPSPHSVSPLLPTSRPGEHPPRSPLSPPCPRC